MGPEDLGYILLGRVDNIFLNRLYYSTCQCFIEGFGSYIHGRYQFIAPSSFHLFLPPPPAPPSPSLQPPPFLLPPFRPPFIMLICEKDNFKNKIPTLAQSHTPDLVGRNALIQP